MNVSELEMDVSDPSFGAHVIEVTGNGGAAVSRAATE